MLVCYPSHNDALSHVSGDEKLLSKCYTDLTGYTLVQCLQYSNVQCSSVQFSVHSQGLTQYSETGGCTVLYCTVLQCTHSIVIYNRVSTLQYSTVQNILKPCHFNYHSLFITLIYVSQPSGNGSLHPPEDPTLDPQPGSAMDTTTLQQTLH